MVNVPCCLISSGFVDRILYSNDEKVYGSYSDMFIDKNNKIVQLNNKCSCHTLRCNAKYIHLKLFISYLFFFSHVNIFSNPMYRQITIYTCKHDHESTYHVVGIFPLIVVCVT